MSDVVQLTSLRPLVAALRADGYRVVGPTVRDGRSCSVASLLGLCDDASYEGQAAIALGAAAASYGPAEELPWRLVCRDGSHIYDPAPTVAAVVRGAALGTPVGRLAAGFHATLVAATTALCGHVRRETWLRTVCLSGGVFQNRLLTEGLRQALRADGFEVFTNERVPTNDGGISYGQAAVAAARTSRSPRHRKE